MSSKTEYHIVTPSGVISRIFEDVDLAIDRFKSYPPTWRIEEVTITKTDITPTGHKDKAPSNLSMPKAVFIGSGSAPSMIVHG